MLATMTMTARAKQRLTGEKTLKVKKKGNCVELCGQPGQFIATSPQRRVNRYCVEPYSGEENEGSPPSVNRYYVELYNGKENEGSPARYIEGGEGGDYYVKDEGAVWSPDTVCKKNLI